MALRESLNVQLVNYGIAQRNREWPVLFPIEVRIDHYAFLHAGRVIVFIKRKVGVAVARLVGENSRFPIDLAGEGFRIRIDQKLVRIKSQSVIGLEWPVDAVAVQLSRLEPVDV